MQFDKREVTQGEAEEEKRAEAEMDKEVAAIFKVRSGKEGFVRFINISDDKSKAPVSSRNSPTTNREMNHRPKQKQGKRVVLNRS